MSTQDTRRAGGKPPRRGRPAADPKKSSVRLVDDTKHPENEVREGAGERAPWTLDDAAELYNINGWGEPYFRINAAGHVEVRPDPRLDRAIDLYELISDLKARGLDLPLLIRFSDILHDRIRRLNESFARAIAEYNYAGEYRGVFPIKVNQQRHLVEEIIEYGRPWKYGLEAGSKPELLVALAQNQDPGGIIICNGYKDRQYIETAILAQQFEKTVIIVLERIEELDIALEASARLGLEPVLGVRAKLTAKGVGRWAESAGDRAKFGLTAAEIVEVIERLSDKKMLHCLQLLHFHIGSQISSILPFKQALREAGHIYVEMARMGCNMRYIDVGGGLAIDYDGSKTDFHASKNYDEQEYAYDVVSQIQEACSRAGLDVPTIVSESGRAVVAHQSILVFEVLGTSEFPIEDPERPAPDAHPVIKHLYEAWENVSERRVQESWHDALQAKEEAQTIFRLGYLSLKDRAVAERMFWSCCGRILRMIRTLDFVPEEVQDLEHLVASIYYCNFSVFQSAPDTWAIDQLFPIMPIHRLEERPTVRATIADLTCDSDGQIDQFIDVRDVKRSLELHPIHAGKPYYLGLFLNGAYQEILGDLHNLFGDTNAVHVELSKDGYNVAHVVKGDSVGEVLHYVQYVPDDMVEKVRRQAERALRRGRIRVDQLRLLMKHYEDSLDAYTYLSDLSEDTPT